MEYFHFEKVFDVGMGANMRKYLYHGSPYYIENYIRCNKAHCNSNKAGNQNAVYTSNKPHKTIPYALLRDEKNLCWEYDGKDTIMIEHKYLVDEKVGYIYFVEASKGKRISKYQYAFTHKTKVVNYVQYIINEFIHVKNNAEDTIIKLDTDKFDRFIEMHLNYIALKQTIFNKFHVTNPYRKAINSIQPNVAFMKYFNHNNYHDSLHLYRVMMLCGVLCYIKSIPIEMTNVLLFSALYHDIGRNVKNRKKRHGEISWNIISSYANEIFSEESIKIIEYLIITHCIDDEHLDISICNNLLYILKDADAIDRLRFPKYSIKDIRIFNKESHEVLKYYNDNKKHILEHKINVDIIIAPFAYQGPSITKTGPIYLIEELSKRINNISFNNLMIAVTRIEESLDTTPRQILKEIYSKIELCANKRTILLGGNHLTMLPAYLNAIENKYKIVTFDAHIDSYSDIKDINHGNFLNYLPQYDDAIICGWRAKRNILHNVFFQNISKHKNDNILNEFLITNKYQSIYLDIDVDVFNPAFFPATVCKVKGGINIDDFIEYTKPINYNRVRLLSISEYSQHLDQNDKCKNIICEIIIEILKKWNSNKNEELY